MLMSVVYTTVNGRLVEENRNGVVTRYVPDTLGNVSKTADVNGNIASETTYWPFGEVRTQVGTNPSPWGFCGVWGYLQDAAARLYVRARYLRTDVGRWLTVDPFWPGEPAYGYARNAPTKKVDPSGLAITFPIWGPIAGGGVLVILAKLLAIALAVLIALLLLWGIEKLRSWICKKMYKLLKEMCGDENHREPDIKCGQCSWDDSCLALFYKFQAYRRCAELQMYYSAFCYGDVDEAYLKRIREYGRILGKCMIIFFYKCASKTMPGRGPFIPIGVPPLFTTSVH